MLCSDDNMSLIGNGDYGVSIDDDDELKDEVGGMCSYW